MAYASQLVDLLRVIAASLKLLVHKVQIKFQVAFMTVMSVVWKSLMLKRKLRFVILSHNLPQTGEKGMGSAYLPVPHLAVIFA